MNVRRTDRLWLGGGVAGAVLLLALGWFLAINPTNADAQGLRNQVAETQDRLIKLRSRLSELQEQKAKLAVYRAALKTKQEALPTDSGVPDFLRQLQGSGDAVAVNVTGVNVGAPAQDTVVTSVFDLPITVAAEGTPADLGRFLDQVQSVQPRAVLIDSASLSAADGAAGGKMTIAIRLTAFVSSDKSRTTVSSTGN